MLGVVVDIVEVIYVLAIKTHNIPCPDAKTNIYKRIGRNRVAG